MDSHSRARPALLLLLAVALSCLGVASAQKPGPVFPFYDSCRRTQNFQLRNVTALAPQKNADGSVEFCFRVNRISAQCKPEVFFLRKNRVVSRCCNTTFAKIKFYANSACKPQFAPSKLTVPLAPQFSKIVSPVWEHLNTNFSSVKYTQFGPIPQDLVDGTTFCLKIAKPIGGVGCAQDLYSIASTRDQARSIFSLSIYDRKTNDYECCPTFSFPSKTIKASGRRLHTHHH